MKESTGGLAQWAGANAPLIEEIYRRGRCARSDRRLRHRRRQGQGRLVGLERRKARLRMAVLGRPHHHPLAPRLRAALRPARARAPAGRSSTLPVPKPEDAHRELLRMSARALGVATARRPARLFPPVARRHEGPARGTGRGRRSAAGRGRRAGSSRPICTPARACRARSRRAPCSRRSIRWSSSGRAPSACSTSATASRSTRRPRSASTATTCCPSCSATGSSRASIVKADRPAGVLRVLADLCRARRAARNRRRTARRTEADAGLAGAGAHRGRAGRRPRAGAGATSCRCRSRALTRRTRKPKSGRRSPSRQREGLRGNAVRDLDPNSAAVPATVSDEPEPKATGEVREGGKGEDPRARRPAVKTE